MSDSTNTTQNNSSFILIIGLLIAIGRIILGSINDDNNGSFILIVMAIVNYIAFGFVLLFLYNGFYNCYKYNLKKSGLSTKQKKDSHFVLHIVSSIFLMLYFLIGYVYITKLYNSNINDAISIFALSVSIATDGLIERYGIIFYKIINKTAKLKK